MKYILVIDEGTTSTRAVLFDINGREINIEREKLNVFFPEPGLVECDAVEIWEKTKEVLRRCVKNAGITDSDIVSIGMTAQRESAIIWEKDTGKPIYNCIIWQDRRTDAYCKKLNEIPDALYKVHTKTGLLITSFFPAVKALWMLDNIPGARERAERGELCFGTVDTWLFYNMTDKKRFVAEQSNAARTSLFNIHTFQWDDELLELFQIPKTMLAPEILPSDGYFGDAIGIFDRDIPIRGSLGDQQAATLGQLCLNAGEGKISLGTSGLMSLNIGDKPSISLKLLSTLGWNINGNVSYHYETGFYFCGGLLDWLKSLGFLTNPVESAEIAASVPDTAGVKFISCFFGLTNPEMLDSARGLISGLTPFVGKAHIVRAALESIGFQTKDACSLINQELKEVGTHLTFKRLSTDGGVSNNDFVMQFIADMLNLDVYRNNATESTALGAFYVSAISSEVIEKLDDLKEYCSNTTVFSPQMDSDTRRSSYNEWKNALNNAVLWAKNIDTQYISETD